MQIKEAISSGNVHVMVNDQALQAQSQVDNSNDDGLSSGAIVGIAIGAVVASALVIIVAMRVASSKDNKSYEIDEAASPQVIITCMDGRVFDVDTVMNDHTHAAVQNSEPPQLYLNHSRTLSNQGMGRGTEV